LKIIGAIDRVRPNSMISQTIAGSRLRVIATQIAGRKRGRPQMFENQTDIGAITRRLTGVMVETQMEEIARDRN
jgi:hypothetical protein